MKRSATVARSEQPGASYISYFVRTNLLLSDSPHQSSNVSRLILNTELFRDYVFRILGFSPHVENVGKLYLIFEKRKTIALAAVRIQSRY